MRSEATRILGLDPGLRSTGWGIVESDGYRLRHVANGAVRSDGALDMAARLLQLFDGLMAVIAGHRPTEAAVEETFVNKNPSSTLKLGLARGVVLLAPARAGLPVAEYAARLVKKSLVGTGGADKHQVAEMVRRLLPGVEMDNTDASDALAVAICHAHHGATRRRWAAAEADAAITSGSPSGSLYVPGSGSPPQRRKAGRNGCNPAPAAIDAAGPEGNSQ